MKKQLFTLLVVTLLTGGDLFANGFQVLLQGNRQLALGNLGVGLRPTTASSLFWNPGSTSLLGGNSVTVGYNPIFAKVQYHASHEPNSAYTAETDNPVGSPFHVFAAWGPKDSKFSFGLGIYTPFGSTAQWDNDWKGQLFLQKIALQAIFIQPTVSFKVVDTEDHKVGIGAGFIYSTGGVNLQRAVPTDGNGGRGSVELDGAASGMGFNAGIYYEMGDKLSAGISYRSQVDMEVDGGDATFDVPTSLQTSFPPNNKFDATLPLPSTFSIGASYNVTEKLMVAAQYSLVGWEAYKSLDFDFETNTPRLEDSESPRNYENSILLGGGIEYMVNDALALRGGVYFDETPVPDGYMTPETPNEDRINYTVGIGYKVGDKLTIDAAALFITSPEREQTEAQISEAGTTGLVLPGSYIATGWSPGISVSYNF